MRANGTLSRVVCVLAVSALWAAPALAAGTGRLYVRSAPRGARVYLDEDTEPRGKTPCLLTAVPAGPHVVRASCPGYVDVTEEVEVPEGAMAKVMLTFATKRTDEDAAGRGPSGADRVPGAGRERAGAKGISAKEDKPPKYVDVDCPVCEATGLVQEMGCPKCLGTGYVAARRCGNCGGTGRTDHRCNACQGRGTIAFGGKEGICARCRGEGKLPCFLCRGTGKIKRPNPEISRKPTMACPLCEGSGFECKAKCLRCSGKGTFLIGSGGAMGGTGVRDRQPTTETDVTFEKVQCPFCGGDGVGPPICRKCRSAGVVNVYKDPTPCPACFGTGHEFRPCSGCRGWGWIISR